MNREFKFREFNHNRMDYRPSINGSCINDDFSKDRNLMQFTGLNDKNGKEIYEGDILKMPYSKKNKIVEYGEFFNCGCCGDVAGIGFDFEEKEFDKVEIIGNIYENPELLSE